MRANQWLSLFEDALHKGDATALRNLFHADSHWRDVLAFTWGIKTFSGAERIAREILGTKVRAKHFCVDPERTPPREATRGGTKCVEVIFKFETAIGVGSGVLRFLEADESKAWTLLTTLEDLKGHEEHVGRLRPQGEAYSRDFA